MPLNEQRRQQLDGIVDQMTRNNEPEDAIRFVVNDFKSKYEGENLATPTTPTSNTPYSELPNYLSRMGQGAIEGAKNFLPGLYEGAKDLGGGIYDLTTGNVMGNVERSKKLAKGLYETGKGIASGNPETIGSTAAQMALGQALPGIVGAAGKQMGEAGKGLYRNAIRAGLDETKAEGIWKVGYEREIPVSFQGFKTAVKMIRELGRKITDEVTNFQQANPQVQVLPSELAKEADLIKPRFNTVTQGQDIAQIDKVKNAFVKDRSTSITDPVTGLKFDVENPIPPQELQSIKTNTYRELRRNKKGVYGETQGAGIEAEKAIAHAAMKKLEDFIPEVGKLNQKDGALIEFKNALRIAVRKDLKSANLFGFKAPTWPTMTAGGLGYFIGGTHLMAGAALLKYLLDQPIVASKFAIVLKRASRIRDAEQVGFAARTALGGIPVSEEPPPTSEQP